MLDKFTVSELTAVYSSCKQVLDDLALLQDKRQYRSVRRRPGVADKSRQFHRRLETSYHQSEHDIIDLFKQERNETRQEVGKMVFVDSAEIVADLEQRGAEPPVKGEERAALRYYDIPYEQATKLIDRKLFDEMFRIVETSFIRHFAIAEGFIADLFNRGRNRAIGEHDLDADNVLSKNPNHAGTIIKRFEGELNDLRKVLLHGSFRSYGLRWALQNLNTVGQMALYLRRLYDAEAYRLENLSDTLPYVSLLEGMRSGAIDATHHILTSAGYTHPVGLSLNEHTLPKDLVAKLPQYKLRGSKTADTCAKCYDKHGAISYAFDLGQFPSVHDICANGNSDCGLFWSLIRTEDID